MQIILVKYVQLFCVTLFFSNNVKCDQLLLKNDNEDQKLYSISACTGRCIQNNGNLTLEECYEDCIDFSSNNNKYKTNTNNDQNNNGNKNELPKKIYDNLEMKFLCRDDTSFVIEIVTKNYKYSENNNYDIEQNTFDYADNKTYLNGNMTNNGDYNYDIDYNEEKDGQQQRQRHKRHQQFIQYDNASLVNKYENYNDYDDNDNENDDDDDDTDDEMQYQIYVIKIHEKDKIPIEKQVYLTNSNLIKIDNLHPNTKYHLSATVVYPNNEYSLIASGVTYNTLKKKYIPKKITNVKINYIEDETDTDVLSAKILWKPAADQTCFYDIVWYSPEMMTGLDISPIEIRDIEKLYTYTIKNLSFGTKYQVAIRGKNTKDLDKESELAWHPIQTPTCLDWYKNNSICPPLKPEILNSTEKLISENVYSLNITWKKPHHLPNYYTLQIRDINRNSLKSTIIVANISKMQSSWFLSKIELKGLDYEVNLTAYSDGGKSSSIILIPIQNYIRLPENFHLTKLTYGIGTAIVLVVIALITVSIIYVRYSKLKRLKEHCDQIEELKQKQIIDAHKNFELTSEKIQLSNLNNETNNNNNNGNGNNNNIGSTSLIDINNLQLNLQEKLCINDEKEIDRNNLKLYEILGEGAFGLVRRGILNLNNMNSIEVAVKTLKNEPSSDDIRAFGREIDVMKSVGHHPNIVGLIGHCTKNKNELMLLTEYCSQGNLQNFLRTEWKFMNKISYHTIDNTKDLKQLESKENDKPKQNTFNYNHALIEKHRIKYKNILLNDSNTIPLIALSLLTSSAESSSSINNNNNNNNNNKNNDNDSRIIISTTNNSKLIDNDSFDLSNDKQQNDNEFLTNDMIVINKGYELNGNNNGTCTNSCKCQVDIILKNYHKNNDIINEIEIQNCDCNNIAKRLSINQDDIKQKQKEQQQQQQNKNENDDKTKPIVLKNKNYYRFATYDKEKSPQYAAIYCEDIIHGEPLTSADLLSIAKQIALGMEFLAKNKVVHRDLAARNVLVCSDRTVKIADFGLSRDVYQENIYKKTGNGKLPIKWLALESMTHQVYTSQSDVWSYGILLYEIITLGGTPYPSVSNNHLLNLLKSGHRMEKPKTCGEKLYSLMLSCWETKPVERPSFTEIVNILNEFLTNPDEHIFNLTPNEFSNKRIAKISEEPYLKPIKIN